MDAPPQAQLKKWKRYADYNWQSMSLEQVRALIALREQNDSDQLEAYGGNAGAPSARRTPGTATGIVRRVEECVIIGQTA